MVGHSPGGVTTSPDGLTLTSLSAPFEIDWSDLLGVANPGPDAEFAAGAFAAGRVVSIDGVTVAGEDWANAGNAKSAAPITMGVSLRMSLPDRVDTLS